MPRIERRGDFEGAIIHGIAVKAWTMSKYEIELVSKTGRSVIGEANDAEIALNVMDEAMREYPTGHIRIRRGTTIFAERMPPRIPSDGKPDRG